MSLYVLDLPLGFQVAEKPKVKRCTSVSQIFNVSLLVSSPLETHAVLDDDSWFITLPGAEPILEHLLFFQTLSSSTLYVLDLCIRF